MPNKTRKLLTGTLLSLSVAVLLLLISSTQLMAGSATHEVANSDTENATLVAGILESNASSAVGVSLDSNSAAIVLGADGTESVTVAVNHDDADLTLTVTTSGTANGVTFADDIVVKAPSDNGESIIILATNDNLTFQGNITELGASTGQVIIKSGSSGANATTTLTFDTVNNENMAVGATIGAVDAADTVNMTIQNTDSANANTVTFSDTIGAVAATIDALTIAANTTVTFSGATTAATMGINSANVTTIGAALATAATFGADGTLTFASGIDLTGSIATSTTNTGSVIFADGTQTVSGTMGANGALLKSITVNGSGTATFNATVFASTVTSNTTGGITMGGTGDDLNANVNFTADGTLTLHDAGMTGNVTTGTTNEGAVATGDAATITGTLGASGAILKMVDINHAATITGTVYATEVDIAAVALTMSAAADVIAAIDMSADGTINLADGTDVTGAISASASNNHGTVNCISAATCSVSGQIGAASGNDIKLLALAANSTLSVGSGGEVKDITLAAGSELKFTESDNVSAWVSTGGITTAGTTGKINVGTAVVTVTGRVNLVATSTLKATIGATTGKLVSSGAAITTHADTLVEPVIKGVITSGKEYTIATSNAAIVAPTTDVVESYSRYAFAVGRCTGDNTSICVTPTVVVPTGVSNVGAAVNAVADAALASDATMADALNVLSGAAMDKALVSLAPAVDGGAIVGVVSAGGASGATISTQMASLRSGIAAGQGLNAGDGTANEERFWTQGFGSYSDQGIREKIAGFTSTTGGVAFGVDKRLQDDFLIGLAYSYAYTNVDAAESNETKVQSHQATVYGSFDIDQSVFQTDGVFLDAQLSYAHNNYEGERNIIAGAVTRRADSDYDGLQISTKFDLGKTLQLYEGFRFTPTVGISYTHVSIDQYTETNAAATNLTVKDQDYDILNLNLKGKLARTWQVEGSDLTPEIHLGYTYETMHDKIQTTSSFQGGGDSFISTGFETANNTFSGGFGVTYAGDTMPVDLTLTYDVTHKEDFLGHSGLIKGSWRF